MVTRGKATDVQLAYLAGLIDGEGCIGLHIATNNPQRRINPRFQCSLVVTNTHKELLEQLQAVFGGNIFPRKKQKEHHKQCWKWDAQDLGAYEVCKAVLPYLVIKRRQAEAVVKFYDEMGPRPRGMGASLTREEVQRRMDLYELCRSLNDSRHPQRLSERAPMPIWEKRQSELMGNHEIPAETTGTLALTGEG
jgi:hypothetical protein